MTDFNIIRVTIDDLDQLQKISRETFYESFASGNTGENMRSYLEEAFAVDKLRAELNDMNSEFYFATLDNEIIGYLKVNFNEAQTELKDDKALEIERIYVYKQFHGKKAGQVLFEKTLQLARQHKADYIWLGVWEENSRAIRFYQKNGFAEFDRHFFRLGSDEQTDIMMKRQLS